LKGNIVIGDRRQAAVSPEGRQIYVGAFPGVPSGDISTDGMVEFGDAYVYTFDGAIFVWEREALTITRYEVSDDYRLIKGNTLAFTQFGLQLSADHLFVSPKRAYVLLAAENTVVVWNPKTMALGATFPANFPVMDGFDTYPAPIGVSGGNVYWALLSVAEYAASVPNPEGGGILGIEEHRRRPSSSRAAAPATIEPTSSTSN
jgi:hypothetical protein